MKIWMADVTDDGQRETAVVFAPHITSARERIEITGCQIEDIFEIELDDPRWDTLYLRGKLIAPQRF